MELSGKRVLITGASRGLGAALAERVPDRDGARGALADMAERFRTHSEHAATPPFGDVVHWAPYVLHGAPLVGLHG